MKNILFLFFGLAICLNAIAQDEDSLSLASDENKKEEVNDSLQKNISFSILNNIWENPAYTGFETNHTFNLNSETFTPFMEANSLYVPMKFSFSYDVSIGKRKRTGLGLYAAQSYFSVEKFTDVVTSFSRDFVIKKRNHLRLSLTLGYLRRTLDFSKMVFGDMIDPYYGFIHYTMETKPSELTKGAVDFNTGVFFTRKNFFVGASVHNITQPNYGFFSVGKIPMNTMINTGYTFQINKHYSITPSAEVFKSAPYNNYYSLAVIGAYNEKYILGFEYKYFSSLNTIVGIHLWDKFKVTASCGLPTDKIVFAISPISYLQLGVRYQIENKKETN